ncbi:MAG: hypothetical protein ACI9K2_002807 [Myxococcota bacterium]
MPSDRTAELWDLYRGLAQRGYGRGSDSDPLIDTLQTVLSGLRRPYRRSFDGRPPRRIASAMAAALFAQPHLGWTWHRAPRAGTFEPRDPLATAPDPRVHVSSEQLEAALGLPQWELDDLREEVDRRASVFHRQVRVVHHLWRRYRVESDPRVLFAALFPGAVDDVGQVDFVQRGGQLYVVVERGRRSSRLALYLSWASPGERGGSPLDRFRSRYADPSLVRGLSRFTGEPEADLRALLDRSITVVPHDDAGTWLKADHWRGRGVGPLSALGWPYGAARGLDEPLLREEVEWDHWLQLSKGELRVEGQPQAVFDALAIERVQEAMRQSYAALLAHLDHKGPSDSPDQDDLALLDTESMLRKVLTPLITWVSAPESRDRIARELGLDPAAVEAALAGVHDAWTGQLNRSWIAPPHAHHTSLLALLMPHLVILSGSLRSLLHATPDPRNPHRDVLQLFTAFYLREAPLERLWIRGLADTVAHDGQHLPEDVPGDWFWGTWQRVLDAAGDDSSHT